MSELQDIKSIGPSYAEQLSAAGYETVHDVATAEPAQIDDIIDRLNGETVVTNATQCYEESRAPTVTIEPGFTETQKHHLIRALVRREASARTRNDMSLVEDIQDTTQQVIDGEPYELNEAQLNAAFTGVNQLKILYQGTRGLSSFINPIRDVAETINNAKDMIDDET